MAKATSRNQSQSHCVMSCFCQAQSCKASLMLKVKTFDSPGPAPQLEYPEPMWLTDIGFCLYVTASCDISALQATSLIQTSSFCHNIHGNIYALVGFQDLYLLNYVTEFIVFCILNRKWYFFACFNEIKINSVEEVIHDNQDMVDGWEIKDTNGGMEIQNNMKLEISCIEWMSSWLAESSLQGMMVAAAGAEVLLHWHHFLPVGSLMISFQTINHLQQIWPYSLMSLPTFTHGGHHTHT